MINFNKNHPKIHVVPHKRRDGSQVPGHLRQHPSVNRDKYRDQVVRVKTRLEYGDSTLLLQTKCNVCFEDIFFYRDKTVGCIAYDLLETPWTVHHCWKRDSNSIKMDIAQVLNEAGHDGYRYDQTLTTITRTPNRNEETITGYILSHGKSMEFSSYRKTASAAFRDLSFVPADRPDGVMRVSVPADQVPIFEEHEAHRLQVRHVRFKRQWCCFAEGTTPLVPGSNEPQHLRTILNLADRCVWCGKTGVLRDRWGFDTENRVECSDCGSRRRDLSSGKFRAYFNRWYYQSRRHPHRVE